MGNIKSLLKPTNFEFLLQRVINYCSDFIKTDVSHLKVTQANLCGVIKLVSLETEGNRATVRTLLFDYPKAFYLIDHSILVNKLRNLAVPRTIVNWIINFLSNRF